MTTLPEAGSAQARRKRIPLKNFTLVFMLKTANQPIAGRCEWQLPERKAVRQNLFNVHFGVFIDFSSTDPKFRSCSTNSPAGPAHECERRTSAALSLPKPRTATTVRKDDFSKNHSGYPRSRSEFARLMPRNALATPIKAIRSKVSLTTGTNVQVTIVRFRGTFRA